MTKQIFAKTPGTDWSKVVKIKKSQLPKAGNGLYALKEFRRGDIVCEYEGEVVTWAECEKRSDDGHEGYVFFFSKNRCIDAYFTPWAFGRYANDARGIGRVAGLRNNAQYEIKMRNGEKRVFIVATMTIPCRRRSICTLWRRLLEIPQPYPGIIFENGTRKATRTREEKGRQKTYPQDNPQITAATDWN
jgi:hypothetical protein